MITLSRFMKNGTAKKVEQKKVLMKMDNNIENKLISREQKSSPLEGEPVITSVFTRIEPKKINPLSGFWLKISLTFKIEINIESINYFFRNDFCWSNSSSNNACYWEEWLNWCICNFFILSGIGMAVSFYPLFPHVFNFWLNLHCLTFLWHFSNDTGN